MMTTREVAESLRVKEYQLRYLIRADYVKPKKDARTGYLMWSQQQVQKASSKLKAMKKAAKTKTTKTKTKKKKPQ